jgi:DNA-binding transcriptional regulator YiaG
MTFTERLRSVGLDKIALASRLGLSVETVYKWRNNPPQYALAYVELLERMRRMAKELAA